MNLVLVFLGGGAGASARYLAQSGWVRVWGSERAYLATLTINVLGGLLMGLLAAGLAMRGPVVTERGRLLLGVGVLGGFTTFSTFSLEVVRLAERRDYAAAGGLALGSVTLAVGAAAAGLGLGRRLFA